MRRDCRERRIGHASKILYETIRLPTAAIAAQMPKKDITPPNPS